MLTAPYPVSMRGIFAIGLWVGLSVLSLTLPTGRANAQDDPDATADIEVSDGVLEAIAESLDEAWEASEEMPESVNPPSTVLPAAIQDAFDRGCGDDHGLDRCDPEIQAKMREFYGLRSAEDLADIRVDFFRTMLIDGYGNDVVAVSFIREAGASPYVEIRSPSRNPDEEQPLRTAISEDVWQQVSTRSSNFDSKLASETIDETGVASMCLHGWFAIVEATYRPKPYISTKIDYDDSDQEVKSTEIVRPDATIRRDAEGACAGGLAIPFAFELAGMAHEELDECSNLDLDDFRNTAELLATCHRLRGDRLAAARAYPIVRELELFKRRTGNPELDISFVDFSGEDKANFIADIDDAFVVYAAPHATSATDVTIQGDMYFLTEGESEFPSEQAKLTIQLHDYSPDFSILSWNVSPRKPFQLPDQ